MKYQVTIQFEMSEELMSLVPSHRTYINSMINKNKIEYYAVSLESLRSWMIINADSKKEVERILKGSPLHQFWTYEIDELFVYDSISFRFPAISVN